MRHSQSEQRRSKIARILLDEGRVQIGELARLFQVSSETIRKDIIELDKQGLVQKSHGGAVAIGATKKSLSSVSESKLRIIEKAMELIPMNSSVLLDCGNICELFARELIIRKDITVITPSLNVARLLCQNDVKTYIVGGEVQKETQSTVNLWTQMCLEQIKVDIAFIETNGFKARSGPCAPNFSMAQVKRLMTNSGKIVYLLADGTQAEDEALVQFAQWEQFTALITDSSITTSALENLNGKIEILLVH